MVSSEEVLQAFPPPHPRTIPPSAHMYILECTDIISSVHDFGTHHHVRIEMKVLIFDMGSQGFNTFLTQEIN